MSEPQEIERKAIIDYFQKLCDEQTFASDCWHSRAIEAIKGMN